MTIVKRSELDVLLDMVQFGMNNGLLSSDSSLLDLIRSGGGVDNQYVLDLAVHAYIAAQLEEECYENYRNMNIDTASGEALDRLGRLVGVPRLEAVSSLVELSISVPVALGEAVTVPAGTRVLLQELFAGESFDFVTRDDFTLSAGSTSGSVVATNLVSGLVGVLPVGVVTGLEGFPTLVVENEEPSTNGRDLEEDDSYRERVRMWGSARLVGTRSCIENYLSSYAGVDGFSLVPLYDGVGTLKIAVDGLSSIFEELAGDVYRDCMLVSDVPPLVVAPEDEVLSSLTVYISKRDGVVLSVTDDELKQLLVAQVGTFVDGGTRRNGASYPGLSIGDDFNPGELVAYLVGEFPELSNIRLSTMTSTSVDADEIFKIETVTVTIE